ncbi:glycosyltransferase family A protein [uncultured Traorella sp.]|uniref:glycosyltransferase family 2 protein n=1 Tax=uncultured Traorella sp. TaxID=1929048 RepID=UPI0025E7A4CF|nr:glycosyltransferase family A protein [uncultured Traorella sp.]
MKVSIIIPVYNSEQYLARCIESILCQSYQNFEIILINDGSTDHSEDIIKSYITRFPEKFKYEFQKNSGAPVARNKGIDIAHGDYITFVDSDDYLDADFLISLIKYNEDKDVIISGYKKTDGEKMLYVKKPKINYWSLFKYTTNWANLYKTSFIKENNIRFERFRIGEDVDFTFNCIIHLNSYAIISYAGYNYFTNSSSVTNTINKVKKINSLTDVLYCMNKRAIESNYKDKKRIYYYFVKTSIFNIFIQRKALCVVQLKNLFENEYTLIKSLECLKEYKTVFVWEKNEELYINLVLNIFILCYKLKILKLLLICLKKV